MRLTNKKIFSRWIGLSRLALGCFIMLLSSSLVAVAQVRNEPGEKKATIRRSVEEEKAREQTRWMYKNLSLETSQYEKINAINLAYAYKSDSLDKVKDKVAKKDGKLKIKQNKEEEIKKTLTEEQYKQFTAHREKQTFQKKSPFTGTYLGQ